MLKKQSIFKKLILNMMPLWGIPLCLMLILLFRFTCMDIKNKEEEILKNQMNAYTQDIITEKKLAMSKSDYIINSNMIRECLEFKSDIFQEKLININKINEYVGAINSQKADSITIYTGNPDIMPSRFTERLEKLTNKDKIIKTLNENNPFFLEDLVYEDALGNKHLLLYRSLTGKNETIIEIKIYLPQKDGIFVTKNQDTYEKDENCLFTPLTDEYMIVTRFDTDALSKRYVTYGFMFFMVGVLLYIVILISSFMITSRTTRTISDYLSKLSEDKNPVKSSTVSPQNNSWEFETISFYVNKLIKENEEKTSAKYRTELEKKRLELELLQSKIDPHILYNSLAAISLRAFKNKDEELNLLISDLTDYYRSVLAQGRCFTTVGEEITLAKKFVRINEISYSQAFTLQTDIEEGLFPQKLLHLILQPFIENAIVHGLAGKASPCIIKITARCDDGNLIFEIYDNGYGMSEKKINELNAPHSANENYAVQNAKERLKLFYGADSQIKFYSKINEYTLVRICIKDE